MNRDILKPYDLKKIDHINGVDHNESICVGPRGEAYTTGFVTCRVFRLDLDSNSAQPYASTAPRRVLGQAVDADGNLYCAEPDTPGSKVTKISPDGKQNVYSHGPTGSGFMSANTPVFDRSGNMYVSDTGSWSERIDGHICRIRPGGRPAEVWTAKPIDTPNGIAIDAEEKYVYYVETWGNSIARIEIKTDGSSGDVERILHMPQHVPDGIAFDEEGRLWIAVHRPDKICVFDLKTRRLEVFAEDWQGEALRGPCHVAFAGPNRDILLASSLDKATVHRFDHPGTRGLHLNNPKI
ncbi:MAG: SMP-30/gluconolactonase/LRE family protein [Terriglobales bacterium]